MAIGESPVENMEMKNKNVLVTGGTGFVGSHLVEALVDKKARVATTFQTLNPLSYFVSRQLEKKVTMVNCDVCDGEKIFDIVTKFDVEYIFHLAAQPLVDVAYNNPRRTLYSNILGTINVLESARLFPKVKAVIVASSDKAYGKLPKNSRYKETDPLRGDHPYEVSKSAADLIAYSYYKTYGLPVVITRFGNIYGEGDLNFSRIIPGIMKSLITKEPLEIRSDGTFVRDYLYVKDVVRGYLMLAESVDKVKGEAFNFGSDETVPVLKLIRLVEKVLTKKVKFKIMNTVQNEIPYQSLDYTKINNQLGWRPRYSISTTMKKIHKWYNVNFGDGR